MSFDPYNNKKKFKSRKFRLDPTDNFKLDRIRNADEKHDGIQKGKLNVLISLAAAIAVFLTALIIPTLANAVVTRRHSDALVDLDKAYSLLLQEEATSLSQNSIAVVEKGGRYYLFWRQNGAAVHTDKKHGTGGIQGFAEINDVGDYIPVVNVAAGSAVEYPFKNAPIKIEEDRVELLDGLQVLSGHKIVEHERKSTQFENVKFYNLMPIN